MKRFTMIILAFLLLAAPPAVCGAQADTGGKKISVVCTTFPQYDWVRQIIGDKADKFDLTLLLNNRIDLHNYQPSVDDIVKILTCDMFIYVGGMSDAWAKDVLKVSTNPKMIVINLVDVLGDAVKKEKVVEGMQEKRKHDHDEHDDDDDDEDDHHAHEHKHDDHGHAHERHHSHEDEHVWLSLRNAAALCSAIADALSSLDAANAEAYKNNLASYIKKLSALDAEYQAAVSAASVKTLLFGDRFPFRYLMDDYGLSFYAAFTGCSAETEAGFETIVFLSKKVDELGLHTVMVTESTDRSIAATVINNTAGKNQKILALDSMQSVTLNDVRNGTTYLSIMEGNLNVLREALK